MSRNSPMPATPAHHASQDDWSDDTREEWVTRAMAAAMANLRSAAPSSESRVADNERRSEWDFKSV